MSIGAGLCVGLAIRAKSMFGARHAQREAMR